MVEQVLAGIGLAVCVALLLWTVLGPQRRDRLREVAQRGLRWRSHRRRAQQETARVIERARRSIVDREGNVYRPKSFDRRSSSGRERRDH